MARGPRAVAASGYYHVVVRGNGKQVIFEDDEDRYRFLNLMRHAMRAGDIHIIAWCFMDNHVHLIVHDEACRLSDAMHALLSPYARYFNKRSNHVGHVFQDRFSAAPVEDDAYLLRAVAYVHANPAKAGAGAMDQYRWSSYNEYAHPGASEFEVVDSDLVLNMLGGPAGFMRFSRGLQGDGGFSTYEVRVPGLAPLDRAKERAKPIMQTYHLASLREVQSLDRAKRDEVLRALRNAGISIRQIEQLTGIGRNTVARVTA